MILRQTLRLVPSYLAVASVIFLSFMTLLVQQSFGATDTFEISIPVNTVVREPAGSQTPVATASVDAALQGRTCTVAANAINQHSVHPGNNLVITTPGGTGSITLFDVERSSDASTSASGQMTFGETVIVTLDMGSDAVFSAGFDVDLNVTCEDPEIEVCRDGKIELIRESKRLSTDLDPPCPAVVSCDVLTVEVIDRLTRKFTVTASAEHATIAGYTFNFGDGSVEKTITSASNTAMTTYAFSDAGTYSVTAAVEFTTSPNKGGNADCPALTVIVEDAPVYDLSLTKQVRNAGGTWVDANDASSAPTFTADATVNWRIVVTNDLTTTATGVAVSDVLPTGLTITSHDGSTAFDTPSNTWSIGTIAGNQSRTLNFATTTNAFSGETTNLQNWAAVTSMDQADVDSVVNDAIDGNQDDEDSAQITVTNPQIPTACLGDRVWIDQNSNGVQDGGEANITGVTMTLLGANGQELTTTTTNSEGLYSFCGLENGDYSVRITIPAGYAPTDTMSGNDTTKDSNFDSASYTSNVVALSGTDDLTIDAGVTPVAPDPASLGNRVWLDTNKNGIQDDGEMNVANVAVTLLDENGAEISSTTTNENGLYGFTNLAPGTYQVAITPPASYTLTALNAGNDALDSDFDPTTLLSPQVTLVAGENNDSIDAGLNANLPVAQCGSLNILSTTVDSLTVEMIANTANTNITGYIFRINGEVVQNNSSNEYTFSESVIGDYILTSQVVTTDGTSEVGNCTLTINVYDAALMQCVGVTVEKLSRTEFAITINGHTEGSATINSYELSHDGEVLGASDTGEFNVTRDTVGTYTIDAYAVGIVDGEPTRVTSEACSTTITVDPEEVQPPVHSCNGLATLQINRNSFRFTPLLSEGTNPVKFIYTVDNKVKQSGTEATFDWTFEEAGTYKVHMTAHVLNDAGQTVKITCQTNVTIASQPGTVLGTSTPTTLPNTGAGDALTVMAFGLIAMSLMAHFTAQHFYQKQFNQ